MILKRVRLQHRVQEWANVAACIDRMKVADVCRLLIFIEIR